jgi:glutamyl/glutaminyl-tRNA synthetase
VFDRGKLEWMNSQYLMNMDLDTIAKLAKPYYTNQEMDISDKIKYLQVVDNARRRTNSLFEMPGKSKMFYDSLDISTENMNFVNGETSQALLKTIHAFLTAEADCDGDRFKAIVIEAGDGCGVKGSDLFSPVRIALYGDPKGPDIPLIFSILEKDETLIRLSQVIK